LTGKRRRAKTVEEEIIVAEHKSDLPLAIFTGNKLGRFNEI
jgi:hypothetical protein